MIKKVKNKKIFNNFQHAEHSENGEKEVKKAFANWCEKHSYLGNKTNDFLTNLEGCDEFIVQNSFDKMLVALSDYLHAEVRLQKKFEEIGNGDYTNPERTKWNDFFSRERNAHLIFFASLPSILRKNSERIAKWIDFNGKKCVHFSAFTAIQEMIDHGLDEPKERILAESQPGYECALDTFRTLENLNRQNNLENNKKIWNKRKYLLRHKESHILTFVQLLHQATESMNARARARGFASAEDCALYRLGANKKDLTKLLENLKRFASLAAKWRSVRRKKRDSKNISSVVESIKEDFLIYRNVITDERYGQLLKRVSLCPNEFSKRESHESTHNDCLITDCFTVQKSPVSNILIEKAHAAGHEISSEMAEKQGLYREEDGLFLSEFLPFSKELGTIQAICGNSHVTAAEAASLADVYISRFIQLITRLGVNSAFKRWLEQQVKEGGEFTEKTLVEKYLQLEGDYLGFSPLEMRAAKVYMDKLAAEKVFTKNLFREGLNEAGIAGALVLGASLKGFCAESLLPLAGVGERLDADGKASRGRELNYFWNRLREGEVWEAALRTIEGLIREWENWHEAAQGRSA